MIYALSDTELRVLCDNSGLTAGVRSPIAHFLSESKKTDDDVLEESFSGLIKSGLFRRDMETDKAVIAPEGILAAKMIMCPDTVITVGRKKNEDGIWYCCGKKNIWYIYSRNDSQKINGIFAYFDTKMLCSWLREQFLKGYRKTMNAPCGIDLELTYPEWFMFLLSQYVYMKHDNDIEPYVWFDRSEISNVNAADYLKSRFRTFDMLPARNIVDGVLEQSNPEAFEITLQSLIKKNVFTVSVNDEGRECFSLTNTAIAWLDNDLLTDTLFFDCKSKNGSYTVLFSLRRTGITAMVDDGKKVRFVSSDAIPFEAYVRCEKNDDEDI